ncbi:MAG: hypothetical protein DWQ20_00925 [Actinobacteria bacterium]|nr:MAG: hypothetical protein DWQ20_00925 [Actinomycetota bacterium]
MGVTKKQIRETNDAIDRIEGDMTKEIIRLRSDLAAAKAEADTLRRERDAAVAKAAEWMRYHEEIHERLNREVRNNLSLHDDKRTLRARVGEVGGGVTGDHSRTRPPRRSLHLPPRPIHRVMQGSRDRPPSPLRRRATGGQPQVQGSRSL